MRSADRRADRRGRPPLLHKLQRDVRWLKQMGMHIQPGWKRTSMALLCVLFIGSCKDEEAQRRLNEATDKVVACKKEVNDLKNQVASLKQQLAQALANPSKIVLTDPEIINLIADLRGGKPGTPGDVKPSLDPQEASKIVFQGARAMQV